MSEKLKPEAWIHEALSALAEQGVSGVKVEVLAKRLKVTKGSFYWHFKNRPELLAQVLAFWRQGRIETIERQVAGDEPADQILRQLLHLYMDQGNPRGRAIELAMRDWARTDVQAAEAVALVDQQRLACVAGLFDRLGVDSARSRAYLFYSYIFGSSLLHLGPDSSEAQAQLQRSCAELLLK